MKLIV